MAHAIADLSDETSAVGFGYHLNHREQPPLTRKNRSLNCASGSATFHSTKCRSLPPTKAGIYKKNGLDVEQFITPSAADVARRSGVTVPKEFIRAGGRDTPIVIGGGSPLIVRWTTDAQADDRVIVACTDPVVRWRIIARPDITNIEQLKGKRLGYSGYGAVTHFVALTFSKIMGWNPEQDLSLMSGANHHGRVEERACRRDHRERAARDHGIVRGL